MPMIEAQPPIVADARRGEGLRRCAAALAGEWTEEDDRILAELERDRQAAGQLRPAS